jgi:hypothetical protein
MSAFGVILQRPGRDPDNGVAAFGLRVDLLHAEQRNYSLRTICAVAGHILYTQYNCARLARTASDAEHLASTARRSSTRQSTLREKSTGCTAIHSVRSSRPVTSMTIFIDDVKMDQKSAIEFISEPDNLEKQIVRAWCRSNICHCFRKEVQGSGQEESKYSELSRSNCDAFHVAQFSFQDQGGPPPRDALF